MEAHFKLYTVVLLLFCVQSFAAAQKNSVKDYPYCNDIYDPSIHCDERYPNGTLIDGNRPDPYSPCSSMFFMCVDGTSYCFNCQIHPPIELYYDVTVNECLRPENIAACSGCVEGVCPTNQPPASTTAQPAPTTTQGGGCPSQTCGNPTTTEQSTTTSPTTTTPPVVTTTTLPPTGPTCVSFEEHLKHL